MSAENRIGIEIQRFEETHSLLLETYHRAYESPRERLLTLERMLERCRKVIRILQLARKDEKNRGYFLERADRAKAEFFGDLDF
jgi:hypothetical protein